MPDLVHQATPKFRQDLPFKHLPRKSNGMALLMQDILGRMQHINRFIGDIDDLSEWISEVEPDGKGVPTLLRHYLKLGGRIAAFNVDPKFSNVVDGLIFVDMLQLDPRVLARLMGKEMAAAYLGFHDRADRLEHVS
jgi:hypothetical protein